MNVKIPNRRLLSLVAILAFVATLIIGFILRPSEVIGTAAPAQSPYDVCLADLRAEYARWVKTPDVEINPKSCDQPNVTYVEYKQAWRVAGGSEAWVAD